MDNPYLLLNDYELKNTTMHYLKAGYLEYLPELLLDVDFYKAHNDRFTTEKYFLNDLQNSGKAFLREKSESILPAIGFILARAHLLSSLNSMPATLIELAATLNRLDIAEDLFASLEKSNDINNIKKDERKPLYFDLMAYRYHVGGIGENIVAFLALARLISKKNPIRSIEFLKEAERQISMLNDNNLEQLRYTIFYIVSALRRWDVPPNECIQKLCSIVFENINSLDPEDFEGAYFAGPLLLADMLIRNSNSKTNIHKVYHLFAKEPIIKVLNELNSIRTCTLESSSVMEEQIKRAFILIRGMNNEIRLSLFAELLGMLHSDISNEMANIVANELYDTIINQFYHFSHTMQHHKSHWVKSGIFKNTHTMDLEYTISEVIQTYMSKEPSKSPTSLFSMSFMIAEMISIEFNHEREGLGLIRDLALLALRGSNLWREAAEITLRESLRIGRLLSYRVSANTIDTTNVILEKYIHFNQNLELSPSGYNYTDESLFQQAGKELDNAISKQNIIDVCSHLRNAVQFIVNSNSAIRQRAWNFICKGNQFQKAEPLRIPEIADVINKIRALNRRITSVGTIRLLIFIIFPIVTGLLIIYYGFPHLSAHLYINNIITFCCHHPIISFLSVCILFILGGWIKLGYPAPGKYLGMVFTPLARYIGPLIFFGGIYGLYKLVKKMFFESGRIFGWKDGFIVFLLCILFYILGAIFVSHKIFMKRRQNMQNKEKLISIYRQI